MNIHEVAYQATHHLGAMQRTDELVQALELVAEVEPSVVVEIGCMAGGTLYAWRQLCADVYGITLPMPNPDYPVRYGAEVYLGDSHDPAALDWLQGQLGGRPVDVLHIDGDHSYAGVKADWDTYSPLVRPGGLVLIHDIANDRDAADVGRFWWGELAHLPGARQIVAQVARPIGFGVITKEVGAS